MIRSQFWSVTLLVLMLAGCDSRKEPATPIASGSDNRPPSDSASLPPEGSNVVDQWLGKWIGPEGTYLVLSKKDNKYVVEIQSLDALAAYEGVSSGDHIEFEREGKIESIRAGNGEETGMKWLLNKKNCLIINKGEGFCRN